MKKSILLLGCLFLSIITFSQVEKVKDSPIYVDKDLVVVGINAKTTDKELLDIRKKILRYTSIRFTEFDVIRTKPKRKKEEGDIRFISMEVDCRDGFNGKISHSFEEGDTDIYGFYRDYSSTHRVAFFIGNLTQEKHSFCKEEVPVEEIKIPATDIEEQTKEE
jgi:hypothetical protein